MRHYGYHFSTNFDMTIYSDLKYIKNVSLIRVCFHGGKGQWVFLVYFTIFFIRFFTTSGKNICVLWKKWFHGGFSPESTTF